MNETPGSIEEKIILATIECIEAYGISGATNRQIAQRASVNLAAINYYFRSKEVLIQRVMEITLKNAFDLSDLPHMPEASAQERCIAILLHLLEGGLQFPNIARAHFHTLLAEGNSDPLLITQINGFIDELMRDLQNRPGALPPDLLKLSIVQCMSTIIMAILAPTLFEQRDGINLNDPETRQHYVRYLVQKLFL